MERQSQKSAAGAISNFLDKKNEPSANNIIKVLSLQKAAHTMANDRNLSEKQNLSEKEQQIISICRNDFFYEKKKLFELHSQISPTSLSFDLSVIKNNIQNIVNLAKSKMDSKWIHHKSYLSSIYSDLFQKEFELSSFKRKNGLSYTPKEASKLSDMLFGVLGVLLIIDVAINGYFIGIDMPKGTVSGWGFSTLIAIAILIFSGGAGIQHRQLKKLPEERNLLLHWAITIFLLLVSICLVSLATNYKLAYEDNMSAYFSLTSFMPNIYGIINSTGAFIIFGVGFMEIFLSFVKGYTIYPDPFPDFNRRYNTLKKAEDDYHAYKEKTTIEIQNTLTEAQEEIRQEISKTANIQTDFSKYHENRRNKNNDVQSIKKKYQSIADTCITYFRDEVRSIRDSSTPDYFGELPQIVTDGEIGENDNTASSPQGDLFDVKTVSAQSTKELYEHMHKIINNMDAEIGKIEHGVRLKQTGG